MKQFDEQKMVNMSDEELLGFIEVTASVMFRQHSTK